MSNKRVLAETILVAIGLITYLVCGLYFIGYYNHVVKLALGVIK